MSVSGLTLYESLKEYTDAGQIEGFAIQFILFLELDEQEPHGLADL